MRTIFIVLFALKSLILNVSATGPVEVINPEVQGSYTYYEIPTLRYMYETKVRALSGLVPEMRAEGYSDEAIARTLHLKRRQLGITYKGATPEYLRNQIKTRNQEKYGDPLGPSIEYLRGKGLSWEDIINKASEPGGADIWYLRPVYHLGEFMCNYTNLCEKNNHE